MVFRFGTVEITSTIKELWDCIDIVGTWLERKVTKEEDILIPNKASVEDIED